jgi:flagellar hook-associated protein 2
MSGSLAMSGVFTSIDWSALISSMMSAESGPLTRLQEQKTEYNTEKSAVNTIQSAFTSFQNVVESLCSSDTLRSVTASTSDSKVVSATATSGAYEGTHTLEVNQLAQAHRLVQSVGATYLDDQIGVGATYSTARNQNSMVGAGADDAVWFTTGAAGATYEFDFGTQDSVVVTFDASTSYSLNEVAAAINEAAGYTMAQVVDEGGDTYKLDLTAKNNGAVGEMTQTLTAGDAVDVLNDEADWAKTDGTDGAAGAFVYTYNGFKRTISLAAAATLDDLSDAINDDNGNPGVTASVLQYNGAYHLVLAANDSGEDYSITIDDAATTLTGLDTADFYEAQAAQNAKYRINGMPPVGTYIESSSNTITNVIDGVTLTLSGVGDATVTVARNTNQIKSKLESLVSNYNTLVETIDLYVGYNEDTEEGGVLQGDSTLQLLLTPIRTLLTQPVPGFEDGSDALTLASQLGITIDSDGQLEFDDDVFNEVLDSNYEALVDFIGADHNGLTNDSYFQYDSSLSSTVAGTYDVKVTFDGGGVVTGAWFRNKGQGEAAWREAELDGYAITGAADSDEAGLQLIVTWDGSSATQTAEVRLQDGFAKAMEDIAEEIIDEDSGTLASRIENYESAVEELDSKIEIMQDRLERKQAVYQAKFARLEAAMAQLDSYRSAYEALFQSLSTSTSSSSSSSS